MEQPAKKPARIMRVLRGVLLAAVIAFAAFSLLGFFAVPPLLRHYMVKGISEYTHRQASVEKITFNPYKLTLDLSGFSLADGSAGEPLLSLERLFLKLRGSSFLKLGFVIEDLRMERPHFRVLYKKDGTFNFSDLMGVKAEERREKARAVGVSIRNLGISEGTVDFTDEQKRFKHQIQGISIDVPFFSVFPEDTKEALEPRLAATINGAAFRLWGKARPFQDHADSGLNFSLEGVDLTRYVAYLPVQKDWKLARGRVDLKGSLSYAEGAAQKVKVIAEADLSVSGLEIKDPEGKPLLKIPSLSVVLGPSEPLAGRIHVRKVLVHSPEVHAARKPDGTLNLFAFIPAAGPGPSPGQKSAQERTGIRLDRLDVKGGKVRFTDRTVSVPFETVLDKLNLAVADFSTERAKKFPFDLSFETEAGEQGAVKGSLSLEPFSSEGEFSLQRVSIQKYRPYYEAVLPLDLDGGLLGLTSKFGYLQPDAENPGQCALSGLTLSLTDLGLKRKGETDAFLTVPNLALGETSVDLLARSVMIGTFFADRGRLTLSRSPEGILDVASIVPAPGPKGAEGQASPGGNPQEAGWAVSLRKAEIDGYAIRFQDNVPAGGPVVLALEPVRLAVEDLSTAKGAELKVALQAGIPARGSLSAKGTVVVDPLEAKLDLNLKDLDLLPFQPYWSERVKLTLRRGRISTAGNLVLQHTEQEGMKTRFHGETTLSGFALVDKRNSEDFLKFKSIYLAGMDLSVNPAGITVDQVALTDFYSRIAIDPKGAVNLQDLIEKRETPASEPPGSAREAGAKGALGELPVTGIHVKNVTLQGGKINFSDQYVKPHVSAELSDVGGRISGLHSDEQTLAEVRLTGKLGRQAPLDITGRINPFRKSPFVDLKAEFRNIDLSPMSPYAGKYIGYTIEKGKLSLELKYLLEEKNLESENRIFLDQFTLGRTVESPQATKLPVALAVSLLTNRAGQIELNLPVKGNLDDPQFSLGQIILKMLGNLLEKALTAPFSLLASVFGGGEELSYLEFPPGVAEVPPEAEEQLGKLIQIMHERPALRLEMQGHAAPEAEEEALRNFRFVGKLKAQKLKDMRAAGSRRAPQEEIRIEPEEYERILRRVYQAENFPKPRDESGDLKVLPPEEMEKLMRNHIRLTEEDFQVLADQRAEAVRDHILKSGKVCGGAALPGHAQVPGP